MLYFGPLCSPPSPEAGEKVPVPVGQPCLHCEVAIAEGDSGFMMPFLDGEGERIVPYHRSCLAYCFGITLPGPSAPGCGTST